MTGHGGTGCGLPYIYIFYHAVPCLFVNTCRVCLTHITFYCRRKEYTHAQLTHEEEVQRGGLEEEENI